jgi:hypothetical protein
MSDIYLDPGAASLPDAADQLRHLTENGYQVYVLGDPPDALAGLPAITRAEGLPATPPAGSWVITTDPTVCGDRRPTLMSMLVGPRPAPSPRPAPRCDTDARDLASAVLKVLSHEAMG